MRLRHLLLVLIALTFGCSTRSVPSAADQFASFDVCEYHVEVHSAGYQKRSIDSDCFSSGAERKDDVTITLDDLTLKIVNGALSLNSRDFGAVKPGDRITLNADGTVSVNGEPRVASADGPQKTGTAG